MQVRIIVGHPVVSSTVVLMRMRRHICLCTQEIQPIEMVYIDESTCWQICLYCANCIMYVMPNLYYITYLHKYVCIYIYISVYIFKYTYLYIYMCVCAANIIAQLYLHISMKIKSSWLLTPRYSRFFRTSMEVCGRSSPRDATTTLSVMWPAWQMRWRRVVCDSKNQGEKAKLLSKWLWNHWKL